MSVPARALGSPAVAPTPTHDTRPRRDPHPRPSAAQPRVSTASKADSRTRGWRNPAFFLFAGIMVSLLVMALVALNAMLVQTTYRMQTVRQEVSDLSQAQVQLSDQVASLSSPQTVARWARQHGLTMPLPGDTIILPVPGVASASNPAPGATG